MTIACPLPKRWAQKDSKKLFTVKMHMRGSGWTPSAMVNGERERSWL